MAEFLKVEEVLGVLDITEGMSAAEFGCGSALFTIALSKRMPKGRVYALDVQEEKLSALNGRMAHEHIRNVRTILADLEEKNGSGLKDSMLDIVLIPNVLFQAENKPGMIEEAARILKPGGQLLIVDWLKQGPFSPKEGMVGVQEVKKMAENLNLTFKKEFAAGDYHYGLLFTK